MSKQADAVFDATVAIAREVVDERSLGSRLSEIQQRAMREHVPTHRNASFDDIVNGQRRAMDQAASEFAAPYLQRIAELQSDVRHLCESNASYVEGAIRLTTKLMASEERIAKLEVENKSLREQSRLGADELHDLGLGTRGAS